MNGSILVVYEYIDGAHFFTSGDKDVKGLCVASPNLETAFEDVTVQLNAIAKAKGVPTIYQPGVAFEEIARWVAAHGPQAAAHPIGIDSLARMAWRTHNEAA